MAVDTFIPNDTKILDEGRIQIITGPNYSGKSIYIKQDILCNGKQAYDCRTVHIYDRSTSSGNDAKAGNFTIFMSDG
ncbi:hypothetical protein COLO4_09681 [Corchorus olitorius]|uniref:Uncharacterized protein n=1 Tax=Corchorus olitorius TaxID=93759 RepID=A0A1R3KBB0_9ROSI|nr:hypothetical protein COLO4_09681 [Corchorus olitorius]